MPDKNPLQASGDDEQRSLHELRAELVRQRSALSSQQRRLAAEQLAENVMQQPVFRSARRIAVYLAVRGEADPALIAADAWRGHKQVYLPVLQESHLRFCAWHPDAQLTPNRYGIPEPVGGDELQADQLDLVFAPLVAFDDRGNRVGMGGGYYDRSFAFRLESTPPPLLVGLAYDFQRQHRLPVRDWDVPLDAVVVTEEGWQSFNR